jgi:hypothetical protein
MGSAASLRHELGLPVRLKNALHFSGLGYKWALLACPAVNINNNFLRCPGILDAAPRTLCGSNLVVHTRWQDAKQTECDR